MKTYAVQGQRVLRNNEYKYLNLSVPTGFATCGVRLNGNDRWCFSRQPVFDLCFSLTLNCSYQSSPRTHADIVPGVNMVRIFSLLRILNINCSPTEKHNSYCLQFPTCCEHSVFYIWHFPPLLCVFIYLYLSKQRIMPFNVSSTKHTAITSRFWYHLTQNTNVQTFVSV